MFLENLFRLMQRLTLRQRVFTQKGYSPNHHIFFFTHVIYFGALNWNLIT